jgi:hypothetical protein
MSARRLYGRRQRAPHLYHRARVRPASKTASVNNYELDCQPGSFTITGTAATLARGLFLDCQPATFAITGTAATLARGLFINAASGSFTLTGVDATLARGLFINAATGSFTITGVDVDWIYHTPPYPRRLRSAVRLAGR